MEPIDGKNRPYRIKDMTFAELIIEEKSSENKKDVTKDNNNDNTIGSSLTPSSIHVDALINFINQLDSRNNATLKQYLQSLQDSVSRMYSDLNTISTLECMKDR